MKVAILGAGAFGTALGGVLADNGYDIDYYDSRIEKERLSDVLENAKVVVLSVPSKAVPYVLPYLPKSIPLVIATKGMLGDKHFEKFEDIMVISGPGFADDIKAGKETKLTATDDRVIKMFETSFLTFDFTKDKKGVLLCGALKNVYAMLAGKLNLKRESEDWNKFIFDVTKEMKEILELNGGEAVTVDLSCGIGDLKLTCGLPSRNYEFGQILRKNPEATPDKTVEGLTALAKIKRGEINLPSEAKLLNKIIAEF